MNCQMFEEALFDFTAGTPSPELADQCNAHMAACPKCTAELDSYRATVRLVSSLKHRELPDTFWQSQRGRIMQAVSVTVASRSWQAPPLSLLALLSVVVVYVFTGLDIGAGILIDLFRGHGDSGSGMSTSFLTLIPLYMGILGLALFVFSERGEKAGSRSSP